MVPVGLVLPEERLLAPAALKVVDTSRPFTPLSAHVALEGNRVSTGLTNLDHVFGESNGEFGMMSPSVIVFAGKPGTGKTTLLLKICAHLQTTDCRFAFTSSEQPPEEIRANVIRLGYGEALEDMNVLAKTRDINEVLDRVEAAELDLVFLDSINKIADPDDNIDRDALKKKVRIVERIIEDSNTNNRIWILISHMNKEDKVFGSLEMLHDVSTIAILDRVEGYPKMRSVSCPEKNRWGETNLPAFFLMGKKGMTETSAPQKDDDDETVHAPRLITTGTDGYPRELTHAARATRLGNGRR